MNFIEIVLLQSLGCEKTGLIDEINKLAGKRWWSKSEVNRLSLISKSLSSSLTRQPFGIDLFLICYAFKFVFSDSVLCYSSLEPIQKESLINVVAVSHCCNTCVQWGQKEVVYSTFTLHSLTTESVLMLSCCSHTHFTFSSSIFKREERGGCNK